LTQKTANEMRLHTSPAMTRKRIVLMANSSLCCATPSRIDFGVDNWRTRHDSNV
jgi:hypothetical protein